MKSQYENRQPAVQSMEITINSCVQVTIKQSKQQQQRVQFKTVNTVVKLLFLSVSVIVGFVIITLLSISLNKLSNQDISFINNKDTQYPNKQIDNFKNIEVHQPTRQHYHELITFKYPTMGMRKPGTTFNFSIVKDNQIQLFQKEMEKVFKPYHDTDCQLKRYGDRVDGGYLICSNFVNDTTALINFGIEGRDYFGCQVSTAFNLTNYQYDCTNSIAPQCPTNKKKNIFDQACLGEKSEIGEIKFYSLKDIIDMNNLTKKHVMMKIDVEGAEWPGLRTFPISYLDYVDQIIFEIHFNGGASLHPNFWGNLDIVRQLGNKFVSVNFHVNNNGCAGGYRFGYFGSLAIQVTLVNKNLIRKRSNNRSYKLHPKNYINNQKLLDCQMKD